MRPGTSQRSRVSASAVAEDTAPQASARRAAAGRALLALAFALACASRPDPTPTPEVWTAERVAEAEALEATLRAQPRAGAGELVVRLAFRAPADLDLWVTDPDQESIYYFNSESRSGGALEGDQGCEAPDPRVETVRFTRPPAGRYRIGVDFPSRCESGGRSPAVYVLAIDGGEGALRIERGILPLQVFRPIAAEIDRAGPSAPAAPETPPQPARSPGG